ncbi:MAG: hypothetical protein TREMPRED_005373, partial [Tremellales sp. Tagirdzhanova-0007]
MVSSTSTDKSVPIRQMIPDDARSISPSDALNRFRITHPDRDLRPLLRRLNRLSHTSILRRAAAGPQSDDGDTEDDAGMEMLRLELMKWRVSIERIMGSVANLERQREVYRERAEETVKRAEKLRGILEEEKGLLEVKRRERDWLVRCDEVAKRITARGANRAELDERIAESQESLTNHRASHDLYLATIQSRIDTFSQITRLVEECRAMKLPIEPQATLPMEEKMLVDEPLPTSSSEVSRLSAAALPFAPAQPSKTRASTPPALTIKPPTSGHALPTRPTRSRPQNPIELSSKSTINIAQRHGTSSGI